VESLLCDICYLATIGMVLYMIFPTQSRDVASRFVSMKRSAGVALGERQRVQWVEAEMFSELWHVLKAAEEGTLDRLT
jgi:hypothetical protein